jgi:hypothetical protein
MSQVEMLMGGLYACTEDWVKKGINTIKDSIKEIEAPIKAMNEQMTEVKGSITTLTEQMTEVKGSITTLTEQMTEVNKQLSGDAPPVTAGVRAELHHVHFELNRAIDKVRLTFWAHVLVFCMQVAILWMMYDKGQAPRVEAPALKDVPRHRLLCDVVQRNPHYDGDGVVVCQYLPDVTGDIQVLWEHMKSSWTYVAQNLRNMTQTQE